MKNRYTGAEIAIIGMSGRFPGAGDLQAFWNNLQNGVESILALSDTEILEEGEAAETLKNPRYVKASSYIRDKENFDSAFFGFLPEEAEMMDPQIRIFLQTCWSAIEDAGYDLIDNKEKIGLFAGGTPNLTWMSHVLQAAEESNIDSFSLFKLSKINFLCTRVSNLLNLQGPSIYLDTACSTSLVAVQRACMSLLLRECNMALAGGVSINNYSKKGYLSQDGGIYSADGHCRAFDAASTGTVGGEGTGVVVLKKLDQAIKDGDHIYAIIKGSGINNDGSFKMSFTAPSVDGQYKVVLKALKMANVPPESIGYVEAHGTGTQLGDPIEIEALNLAFGKSDQKTCALGSVKTNIGHTDMAAGVASLIKAVLSVQNRKLPPSLHFHSPNPKINFDQSPFYVNTELRDWTSDQYPLRAGVSSFGMGGTNAHVILEEAPQREASSPGRPHQLLLVSAKSTASLKGNLDQLCQYLETRPNEKLADIAYTLQLGRSHFAYRKMVVCQNREVALEALSNPLNLNKIPPISTTDRPTVVFMFSGQGSQYVNMCADLYREEVGFRQEVDHCLKIVHRLAGMNLKSVIFSDRESNETAKLNHTAYTQPALFIIEYALARQIMKWGIQPDMLVGHSIGEYVAACISGVFSLEDALRLVVKRGALMQQADQGKMLSIAIAEKELIPFLEAYPALSLAAINSSENCVVSGEEAQIQAFQQVVETRGFQSRILWTSHAFHSHMMDPVLADFEQAVRQVNIHPPEIPFVSNLSGKVATYHEILDTRYWVKQLRNPVRFADGIARLLQKDATVFVETGPGKVLSSLVASHQNMNPRHSVINLVRHPKDPQHDGAYLLAGLGKLWTQGIEADWDAYYASEKRNRIPLPTYAFEKTKYPVLVNPQRKQTAIGTNLAETKQNSPAKWLYAPTWRLAPIRNTYGQSATGQCSLFLMDGTGIGESLLGRLRQTGERVVSVQPGEQFLKQSSHAYQLNPASDADFVALFKELATDGLLPDRMIHGWGLEEIAPDFARESELYCYSLIYLLQAAQGLGGLLDKKLIVVTSGLHNVLDPQLTNDPVKALMLGALKVAPQEYPSLLARHIDVSLAEQRTDSFYAALFREIVQDQGGKVIALRNTQRWEQTHTQLSLPEQEASVRLRQRGVYLITGGLGEVGVNLAKALLSQYQARVILLGRTPLGPQAVWNVLMKHEGTDEKVKKGIGKLKELQETSADVHYIACNIAREEDLRQAVSQAEAKFGAIQGVIHAAGLTKGPSINPLHKLGKKDFEMQFEPKVKGLQALEAVFQGKPLDFCLLTSSLSAVLGGLGFTAYASANAYMDYFVQSNSLALQNWISVNLDGLNFSSTPSKVIDGDELFGAIESALSLSHTPQLIMSATDLFHRLEKWITHIDTLAETEPNTEAEATPDLSGTQVLWEGLSTEEHQLRAIWRNFFRNAELDIDANFFEVGGDSLRALAIIKRIHKELNIEIGIQTFFNKPTVRLLAQHISGDKVPVEPGKGYAAIPLAVKKDVYPLSSAQKRLYFLYEFNRSSLAYNLTSVISLQGNLDKDLFNQSLKKLIASQEMLRTAFEVVDNQIVQRIMDQVDFDIEYFRADETEAQTFIRDFARPFQLDQPPLLRVGLIETAPQTHLLILDMHHIISDGVSKSVFVKYFTDIYKGAEPSPPALQYKDYADWQQSESQQNELASQRTFWLDQFAEEVSLLQLPIDFPRPQVQSFEGDTISFSLNQEATQGLKTLADQEGATLFMVLLGLLNVLLSKLSKQEDITIGTPVANRPHADLEEVIGMFVNTLALRNYPRGELSFREFLAEIKSQTLACFANQSYPYEELIEELNLNRDTSRNALFDVSLVLHNVNTVDFAIPDLKLEPYPYDRRTAKFDMTLEAAEDQDQLSLTLEYNTRLFKRETIETFIRYFKKIVVSVTEDLNQKLADITLLSPAERTGLLQLLDHSAVPYPTDQTLTDLFYEQVQAVPDNAAVQFEGQFISYAELELQSNHLATRLRAQGVQANVVVGLLATRGIEMVIGMLGILKAGGAYLPLDVDFPQERLAYMLSDSRAHLLLLSPSVKHVPSVKIPVLTIAPFDTVREPVSAPEPVHVPSDLCYVIYTSGTTGKPKGVMVEHRNVVRLFFNEAALYDFHAGDVWTMFHSHCFDFSVWELYGALLYGGKVIIIPKMLARDTSTYLDLLKREQVSVLNQTPTAFYNLIREEAEDTTPALALRYVIFGGEALSPPQLAAWLTRYPETKLINMYGITETTVHVTYKEIGAAEIASNRSNIGIPIPTLSTYLLDRHLQLVPPGVVGELYVGGAGVARGYIGNETLTTERFIPHPFHPQERLYKTGDLVRLLESGELEYLGRADAQVQLRGHRIELGEIEHQLSRHDHIKESVVIHQGQQEAAFLVAYYLGDAEIPVSGLRAYLQETLPEYMIPAYFVQLAAFPLTPNGKLDRKALPEPEAKAEQQYVPPQSKDEKLLASIWAEVLGIAPVGLTDNFFALGGDSIKSIQISARVRKAGYELSVQDQFHAQRIDQLAARLKPLIQRIDQAPVTGPVALAGIQKAFFQGPIQDKHHYNQAVMLNFPEGISAERVKAIVSQLQVHHDALRMVFREQNGVVLQENQGLDFPLALSEWDLRTETEASKRYEYIQQLQTGIKLETGPLMKLGLFHQQDGSRLLIVIHHLVVDGVSWRILFEDFETLYQQHQAQQVLRLPSKTTAYQGWSAYQQHYLSSPAFARARSYWNQLAEGQLISSIAPDFPTGTNHYANSATRSFQLDTSLTTTLLREVNGAFQTQINDLLLAALALAINKKYDQTKVLIALEGHGREALAPEINVSRTVGWFTSIYPVLLSHEGSNLVQLIKTVKEQLRQIPNHGVDYLLYRHFDQEATPEALQPQILFNYLGQFDTDLEGKSFQIAPESVGDTISPQDERAYEWELSGIIREGKLEISCKYSVARYAAETMTELMDLYRQSLTAIIACCSSYEKSVLTPSDFTYKALSIAQVDALQSRLELADLYPLSPMQEGMYFHALVNEAADHYFEQFGLEINGSLEISAVKGALQDLMARHPVLRTNFLHEGYPRPLQLVWKEKEPDFQFYDLQDQALNGTKNAVLESYLQQDRARKFDLGKDPLIRLTVLQTADWKYEMIWSFHHILMDGWCVQILFQDFQALYQQRLSGQAQLLPAVTPYATYIDWLEQREKEASAAYWKNYLEGYETLTGLPSHPESARAEKSFVRASHRLQLEANLLQQLRQRSEQYGITLNTLLQTAWGILLAKYNDTRDVAFGAVVSGRPAEIEGIERMVGLFINTIPVRIKVEEGQTVAEILQHTQAAALTGEAHHYHPLSEIQAQSDLGRGLLDHIMVFENYPVGEQLVQGGEANAANFRVENVRVFEQTNYDLTLMIVPSAELELTFQYNAQVYKATTMEMAAVHLQRILTQLASQPSIPFAELSLLAPEEEQQILTVFNDTQRDYPQDQTIVSLFEKQVAKTPDHIAVRFANESLSYAQLNEQADRLAAWLRLEQDVKTGDLIGVMLEREAWLIPTIFGILKAGAAYVPISPANPEERKLSLIQNAGLSLVFTRKAFSSPALSAETQLLDLDHLAAEILHYPVSPTAVKFASTELAYVIYTSGSTGKPKGVMIEHHSVVNRILWMQAAYPIGEQDVLLQKTPIIFDVSVWELFWWSFQGASLMLLAPGEERDPQAIVRTIARHQVTTMHFVPSMLNGFLSVLQETFDYTQLQSLRQVFASGEALTVPQVEQFGATLHQQIGTRLINLYGPTEATVDVSYFECTFEKTETQIPIGKPIQNIRLYVLTKNGQLSPVGISGELAIAGVGLARGYLGNEALTADKFVENPIRKGERIYLTGDLTRWRADGNIEFLGRIDHQVKIRGYRIELGEIENHLSRHPEVEEAVVLTCTRQEDLFLVAYYTSALPLPTKGLKSYLAAQLPDYMVPAFYVQLEEIPLTPSGKINRRALPEPILEVSEAFQVPGNEIEAKLVEIWSGVLGLEKEQISLTTNFFDLGGHSIKLLQVNTRVNEELKCSISVGDMFRLPTIAGLADFIAHGDNELIALEAGLDERQEALSLIDND